MQDKLLPLVTYVVPSFNHGEYIKDCLNSILNDGYHNKELLVVDDGSRDNSVEIIGKWINSHSNRIDVRLYTQDNKGISKTLNLMIERSSGEYIRFIASDDMVKKFSTKNLLNTFNQDIELGCVFGDCEIIDNLSKILYKSSLKNFYKRPINNYLDKKKLKKEIILNWSICGPSSMYKKSIFNKVGKFDENLIIEDWDMFIRLVKINSIMFTPEIVASYRFHKNNTSRFNDVIKRLEVLSHIKKTIVNNMSSELKYEDKLLRVKTHHVEAKILYLNSNYIRGGLEYIKYILMKLNI